MQIPNFLLAMPMLYLSGNGCYQYVSHDWVQSAQLGLAQPESKQLTGRQTRPEVHNAAAQNNYQKPVNTSRAKATQAFRHNGVAAFMHQWALMTMCATLVMNVQVATR